MRTAHISRDSARRTTRPGFAVAALRLVVLATLLCTSAASFAISPLSAKDDKIFRSSPEDPPTKELLGVAEAFVGKHYMAGDEWNMELFLPHVANLGGAYVGVGSDQSYLFMGWQKPELVFQMDYDPWVVDLHAAYHLIFREAKTPDEFMSWWSRARSKELKKMLNAKLPPKKRSEIVRVVWLNKANVRARLRMLRRAMKKRKVACFLTDQGQYSFVRDMIIAGRVRTLSANLLDDEGVVGIGAVLKKLGVPVRLLYLSNAETYWRYSKQFRKNMWALPHDEKSVVLRTTGSWSINKDYRYYVQPLGKFHEWLKRGWVYKVHMMIKRRKLEGPKDVEMQVLNRDVTEVEAIRQRRMKRRARKKRRLRRQRANQK
ncbi:MAG: hypothetical protein KC502_11270 [Myxococcales bacterium]|nr:hypothetical protein [Myxococcales bacterium]